MANRPELVRGLFDAYRQKDRDAAERLLADDFTFTSPYDEAIDGAAYFERCWPTSEHLESQTLEEVVESGSRIFVLYLCRLRGGKEFRNVETFDFEGDRIRAINVYFGGSSVDGAFETPS